MTAAEVPSKGAEQFRGQLSEVQSALAQHTPGPLMCTCGRPNPCSVRQRFDERRGQILAALAVLDRTRELPQLRPCAQAEGITAMPRRRRLGKRLQRIVTLLSQRRNW